MQVNKKRARIVVIIIFIEYQTIRGDSKKLKLIIKNMNKTNICNRNAVFAWPRTKGWLIYVFLLQRKDIDTKKSRYAETAFQITFLCKSIRSFYNIYLYDSIFLCFKRNNDYLFCVFELQIIYCKKMIYL